MEWNECLVSRAVFPVKVRIVFGEGKQHQHEVILVDHSIVRLAPMQVLALMRQYGESSSIVGETCVGRLVKLLVERRTSNVVRVGAFGGRNSRNRRSVELVLRRFFEIEHAAQVGTRAVKRKYNCVKGLEEDSNGVASVKRKPNCEFYQWRIRIFDVVLLEIVFKDCKPNVAIA